MASSEWTDLDLAAGAPHDALPLGVPAGYDWATGSVRHAGNQIPVGFKALIGWGQVFWVQGTSPGTDATAAVEIRDMKVLACRRGVTGVEWTLVQQGSVEGAAFRPDYANNESVAADVAPTSPTAVRVRVPLPRAYHFWPSDGRVDLPSGEICGLLVAFQARATLIDGSPWPAEQPSPFLAGAGADYWLDRVVGWDQYRTNASVGVGQLRRLTASWRWVGFTTAASSELNELRTHGYTEPAAR
jgi:hypothetical protein